MHCGQKKFFKANLTMTTFKDFNQLHFGFSSKNVCDDSLSVLRYFPSAVPNHLPVSVLLF